MTRRRRKILNVHIGVSKGKRLLVDEESQGLAQKSKRSRVAPEVLNRIIEGLRMEDTNEVMKE